MSMLFSDFFQKNSCLLIFNIKFTFLPASVVKTTIDVICEGKKQHPSAIVYKDTQNADAF